MSSDRKNAIQNCAPNIIDYKFRFVKRKMHIFANYLRAIVFPMAKFSSMSLAMVMFLILQSAWLRLASADPISYIAASVSKLF